MTNILDLQLFTQTFNKKVYENNLNGFILSYNNSNYIISVHHFLPIDKVMTNNSNLDIIVNSCWSEILICSGNIDNYTKYKKINTSIPKERSNLQLVSSNDTYEMVTTGIEFIPFDNIDCNILMPYIKATFISDPEIISGISGSPVFLNNNLIGVFSKYNIIESCAYIIPIYIVLKNIIKKNNDSIFIAPCDNIKKINIYNVKNNYIYHPTLKLNIPVNTLFLLEGDDNYNPLIKNNKLHSENMYPIIKNDFIVTHEKDIINEENIYKINIRILSLLNKDQKYKNIIRTIFENFSSDIKLIVVKNKVKII